MLPELLEQFYIIHLCGKGNLDEKLKGVIGYAQFEYASAELTDMFALADLAISRAGANSICELLALHKPNILIPLSAAASRGDQILNAKSFAKQGFSYVIEEEKLTDQTLLDAVREVYADREKYIHTMSESGQMDSIGTILILIESASKYITRQNKKHAYLLYVFPAICMFLYIEIQIFYIFILSQISFISSSERDKCSHSGTA